MSSPLQVTIELDNVGACTYKHWHRCFTLSAPDWKALIGRSTSSTGGQQESPTNALFSSRVVSRDHAVIRANPDTRTVTIEDVNSLHGTRVDDIHLSPLEPEPLYRGATITLGTEVERVEQSASVTFKPVTIQFSYSWSDEENEPPASAKATLPLPVQSRNTFTVEYSDHGPETPQSSHDDADDVAYLTSPLQMVPRTFTVPSSSDLSDDHISIISDEEAAQPDSPTSSPVGPTVIRDASVQETQKPDALEPVNSTLWGSSNREPISIDSDLDTSFHRAPPSPPASATDQPPEQQKLSDRDVTYLAPSLTPEDEASSRLGVPDVNFPAPKAQSLFLENILDDSNSESETVPPRVSDSFDIGPSTGRYDPTHGFSYTAVNQHIGLGSSIMNDVIKTPVSDDPARVETNESLSNDSGDPFAPSGLSFRQLDTLVGCKRKLADAAVQAAEEPNKEKENIEKQEHGIKSKQDNVSMSVDKDSTAPLPYVEVSVERPAKQQKTEPPAQQIKKASHFGTFAVGALAGVAVGSVSTLLGLAALPADYFNS